MSLFAKKVPHYSRTCRWCDRNWLVPVKSVQKYSPSQVKKINKNARPYVWWRDIAGPQPEDMFAKAQLDKALTTYQCPGCGCAQYKEVVVHI